MPSKNRNKSRKKTTRKTEFKPGHQPWNRNLQLPTAPTAPLETTDNNNNENFFRLQPSLYKTAIQKFNGPVNTLPVRLRPEKEERQEETLASRDSERSENIIVNFHKLQDFIKLSMKHKCKSKNVEIEITNRKGLCISMQTSCSVCGFNTSPYKLYLECDTNKRGPKPGSMNEGLPLATLKSKMGASDVQLALSCLDIQVPCLTTIKKKINKHSDKMVELNNDAMVKNQEFAGKVSEIIGEGKSIHVETDTCYNNRNQAGFEAGTQSFSAVIEKVTGKNLPIVMSTANKLCSKGNGCDHSGSCSKTYGTDESISSSESKLATKNFNKIKQQDIVNIKSVTSDASAQLGKVIKQFGQTFGNPIQYYQCFIHRLRTLQKNIKSINFSNLPPGYDRDIFRQRLATCIRARVRMELVRIHEKCTELQFPTTAQSAVKNIIPCFSGNHSNCSENSEACCAHLDTYNTKFLPYGNYLNLGSEDIQKLQTVLNKSLSLDVLQKICRLHTTNGCESLHHRVFTYAPKSVLFKRNFDALCHSACHSSTFGTGLSSLLLANAMGIKYTKCSPFSRYMVKKDSIALYDSERKKTAKYKMQRYLAKCKKMNRRVRQGSIYTNNCSELSDQHNYGINVNK